MTLLIQAVDGRLFSLVDASGHAVRGRFAARDKGGAAMPGGELVRDHTHYRRAILRGDIKLVAEQEHS
tara:strand:+ start:517 stop:720 length:204 start_codon:yes stop_codon:yes gene_type:complete